MLIIPAIDIKNGNVVRLFQGKENKEKVYSKNPLVVARHWQKQGAKLIHVVDLDGAFSGKPVNLPVVRKMVKALSIPIEFGGGIRDEKAIEELLKMGVKRVILGTRAAQDRDFLRDAIRDFAEAIIVSIDARDGLVLTEGWQKDASLKATDFAVTLRELGANQIIYTDTSKDGTLRGPNVDAIMEMITCSGLKVIASGGISSLEDIIKLRRLENKGVEGVIIGKALYEGRFTLKEALRLTGPKKRSTIKSYIKNRKNQ